MSLPIPGSTFLVTGGSSGIGAALAPMLAERGATVAIVGRREDRLAATLERCRDHAPGSQMWLFDLADVDGSVALVDEIWSAMGGLDGVVHNAAMPKRRRVTAMTADELDQVMRTNFFTPARTTMALLPKMLEQGRGSHVYVSSMGGRAGIPHESAYCASKFALCGWAETLFIDLVDDPIDIRLMIPGPIDTDIWGRPDSDPAHYTGELFPPDDVATGICELVEGDTFEAYVPDLKGVAEFKTVDPDAYLLGAADMVRQADAARGTE